MARSDAAPAARPRPHLLHLCQDLKWLPEQLESPAVHMSWRESRLTQSHFWSWPSNQVHHSSCYDTTSCSKGPSFPLAHLRYHRSACRPSSVSISSPTTKGWMLPNSKVSQTCLSDSKSSRIMEIASRIWGSRHLPLPSVSASLSGLPQPLKLHPTLPSKPRLNVSDFNWTCCYFKISLEENGFMKTCSTTFCTILASGENPYCAAC